MRFPTSTSSTTKTNGTTNTTETNGTTTTAKASAQSRRVRRTLGALAATGALLLAACGNGGGEETDTAAAESPPAAPAADGDAVAVRSAATGLGDILVGEDGLTLYGFTNDTEGTSTCSGTCADAWPPVLVSADWQVGPGLDSGIFSTIRREDGSEQLMAGKWPLYYYSGDSVQGDLLGQGSGDVWFVVGLDAALIKDAAPAPGAGGDAQAAAPSSVKVSGSPLGEILTDGEGNTLYGFTNDEDGVPTCTGDCAATWPAHLVEGEPVIDPNLDPAVFSVVDGVEGGAHLKAGKWPLYRFSGDAAPGDVNGQGSGGVWFVVAADGSLIKEAPAPAEEAPAEEAPADDSGYLFGGRGGNGGGGGNIAG